MIYKGSFLTKTKKGGENKEEDALWQDERDVDELVEDNSGFEKADFEEAEDYPMDFEE